MGNTCVLIRQQVCIHSAMKNENDVSNTDGCLQFVKIYSFMKEIKLYARASYIVFFKRNKTIFPVLLNSPKMFASVFSRL